MLEAVQEAIGDREFWSMKPALIAADGAAVELRRALDRMIAAEFEASRCVDVSHATAAE